MPRVLCDNVAATKLADHPTNFQRSKHIDVKYHWTREKQNEGLLKIERVSSEDNVADILTKGLSRGRFEKLRAKLGLEDVRNVTARGSFG